MSTEREFFMAQCQGCPSDKGGHPRPFESRFGRAEWVGKHRVTTGHSVKQWLEILPTGIQR